MSYKETEKKTGSENNFSLAPIVSACTLSRVLPGEEDRHIIFNMSDDDLSMELPALKKRKWYLVVGTSRSIK